MTVACAIWLIHVVVTASLQTTHLLQGALCIYRIFFIRMSCRRDKSTGFQFVGFNYFVVALGLRCFCHTVRFCLVITLQSCIWLVNSYVLIESTAKYSCFRHKYCTHTNADEYLSYSTSTISYTLPKISTCMINYNTESVIEVPLNTKQPTVGCSFKVIGVSFGSLNHDSLMYWISL